MRIRIKVGICFALLAVTASVVGASPSDTALQGFEDQRTVIVEKASESVVSVEANFGAADSGEIKFGTAATGFIIDENGTVLTTTACLRGGRGFRTAGRMAIEVTLKDGRRWPMRVVGSDPRLGVALLRPAPGAAIARMPRPLPLGDSAAVRAGALVVVIANHEDSQGSVSLGVVEGVDRDCPWDPSLKGLIQITAGVASGTSGAPVLNLRREVVGMVVATAGFGGFQGATGVTGFSTAPAAGTQAGTFAIGINDVKEILDELKAGQVIRRPSLGAVVTPSPTGEGAEVVSVQPGGAAEAAGIKPGDVIVRFDGEWVDNATLLSQVVSGKRRGAVVELWAVRGERLLKLGVTLGAEKAGAPPAKGGIAFMSDRDGNWETYTMNPDGTDLTNLTNYPAYDGFACWSPDGNKIAFETARDGNTEIYVMNRDGSNQVNLTNNPADDFVPSWSPDGTKIAFCSHRDGATQIYVMNSDGTNQTRLTNETVSEDWAWPSWSPDGSKIAFVSKRGGRDQIYVMNADGTNQTNLTNNPGTDGNPSWSPDGRKIAFYSDRNGNNEIYVMNSDGSNQTRLTNNMVNDASPCWSPDGSKIAFDSNRDAGNHEIYVMNSDGSDPTRLTNDPAVDWRPSWSPY